MSVHLSWQLDFVAARVLALPAQLIDQAVKAYHHVAALVAAGDIPDFNSIDEDAWMDPQHPKLQQLDHAAVALTAGDPAGSAE